MWVGINSFYNEQISSGVDESDTERYRKWKESQNENKSPGGDFYRTLGSRLEHRLVVALANSAKEGRTQYTEVYRLTNTNRKTFSKLLCDIAREFGVECVNLFYFMNKMNIMWS